MELLMMSVSLAAQTWSADPSEASPAPANATQGGEDDQWDPDWRPPDTWYGNIQYLANISIIGTICCLFFFLLVKVRSDHRLPGLASLAAKLLAAWRTTGHQVAHLCGANAYQFLAVEGYSFVGFMAIAIFACLLLLPLNLYGGKVLLQDEFLKLTVIHIKRGSFLLWGHFLFTVVVVGVVHLCIQGLEQHLVFTRFHDGQLPDSAASAFTLIIHGVSRTLAVDSRPLQDYFEHHYPGKVFRVIVPPDLSLFLSLKQKLIRVREKLAWLRSATREQEEESYLSLDDDNDDDFYLPTEQESNNRYLSFLNRMWKSADVRAKQAWYSLMAFIGLSEEERIQKLQAESTSLEGSVFLYKEGRAVGAGIAFVVFKDVYTASRALLDLKDKHRNSSRGGRAELLTELHLGRSKWEVERAPPARDIYWHHLGCSSISRLLRRIMVNIVLLIFLLFCSSPLAAFNALHNAGRLIINPDAMDRFRLWLAWVQSSSWAAAIILQFLPNVLIFVSMYFIIPAVLTYLSSFESHLTVSGEETAVLVKTVSFFLVNLIILRGLLETTLESALLRMGRCYVEGSECEGIWQYMSNSFLANSCLSAMAFLITSSFLGISFDLLAPIPWIRRKLGLSQRQRDNANGDLFTPHTASEGDLQEALLLSPEDLTSSGLEPLTTESYEEEEEEGVRRVVGRGLSAYRPPSGAVVVATRHSKAFDYAQYYAFNLSIFAMALIYSTFVPTIVPIGAFYFGYRYIVDKYNFLFVYRVRGFPATNDGKLMGTVLRVMRLCLVLYLLAMLFFFSVRGDKQRLQFLCTLALLVLVIARYGIEKLLFASSAGFNSVSSQGYGSIEDLVEGPLEYEIYSQPDFEWDRPSA